LLICDDVPRFFASFQRLRIGEVLTALLPIAPALAFTIVAFVALLFSRMDLPAVALRTERRLR
jgi:hypothetical protein